MNSEKNQSSNYKTWVEINAAAVRHNFVALARHIGNKVTPLCVIKSNAYGHGLLEIASIFRKSHFRKIFGSGTSEIWFGVDSVDEAIQLKKAGIKNPVLILGYVPPAMLPEIVKNGFRVVLYDLSVLKQLAALAKKYHKKVFVHVKIETGTHRQGVMLEDIEGFARALKKAGPHVVVEGAYTHFADTENPASRYYQEQLKTFEHALRVLESAGIAPHYLHVSASAALLLYPEAHFNMARLGIALYGMYPSEEVRHKLQVTGYKLQVALRPALTWKTRVAQVKKITIGKTIGYGRAYTAKRPMRIAVLPVGYWDGYDRRFSSNGEVLVHGKRACLVGKVCMNMMMVDITQIADVRAGDEVVLLGKQGKEEITPEELASRIGTINYEVTTRINPLIKRIAV